MASQKRLASGLGRAGRSKTQCMIPVLHIEETVNFQLVIWTRAEKQGSAVFRGFTGVAQRLFKTVDTATVGHQNQVFAGRLVCHGVPEDGFFTFEQPIPIRTAITKDYTFRLGCAIQWAVVDVAIQ